MHAPTRAEFGRSLCQRRSVPSQEVGKTVVTSSVGDVGGRERRQFMATMRRTQSLAPSPREDAAAVSARAAPPRLLRCLVVSPCAERRRLIRAAAESQAWDAILCRDAGEFLRAAFKRLVPLIVVDL